MSSTNKTTNYNLSQFIGSDKPAWLVDYNGDMSAIDTQMKANADAASAAQTTANTADGKADTNAGAISTLDSQINGVSGLAAEVVAVQGSVNTINSLIGNGEPTTTDKTLIGAINEINSAVSGLKEGYEIVVENYKIAEVTADGVKTYAQLFTELALAVVSAATSLPTANEFIECKSYFEDGFGFVRLRTDQLLFKDSSAFASEWNYIYAALDSPNSGDLGITDFYGNLDSAGVYSKRGLVAVSKPSGDSVDMTGSDLSSNVPTSGIKISIIGNRYVKE